ncbi:hypothetical protein P3S68_005820 [Capsicum galapagoense]
MTFAIEIEEKHVQRSARVKSLDIHPTEPWILVSLYTGTVQIWNYQSQVSNLASRQETLIASSIFR